MTTTMAGDDKARLYKRLIRRAPTALVLERMRVHGFWPEHEGLPPDPPEEAAERERIEAQLALLEKVTAQVENPARALAKERKRRWDESKRRRQERAAERAAAAKARREAWEALRQTTVAYAGPGVSSSLSHTVSDVPRLTERGLPVLNTAADVAALLEIPIARLRWLTYHRRGATLVHYHRFEIAKKTGGVRCISAPKSALAAAQRAVLDRILGPLEVEPDAHGFVRRRSVVTNARSHCGRAVVINLDLQSFFPTVTFRRVRGLFLSLGYSGQVAAVLALLCTEPPRVRAEMGGRTFHVALSERVLPQGACTSPALTNALCRRLDRRLRGLARRHGFTYSRYADDLTFSGDRPAATGRLLRTVRSIVTAEGFREHPTKTRVMRTGTRQEVTGVVVNQRPTIARQEVRTLRAILHNAARDGLESQNRSGHPAFAAHLKGRVDYIRMVDRAQGERLARMLDRALAATPSSCRRWLDLAVAAVTGAGAELRELRAAPGITGREVDQVLADLESRIRSQVACVTEERGEGGAPGALAWAIGLPGRQSLVSGGRGDTVCLALLRDGRPVLGVVFAFDFPDDRGDLLAWAEGCGPILRNGRPVRPARRDSPGLDRTVLTPPVEDSHADALAAALAPARFVTRRSMAHRLALVAAGEAAAAVGPDPCSAAGIAAGHALLRGARLDLLALDGTPVEYPPGHPPEVAGCLGGRPELCERLRAIPWPVGTAPAEAVEQPGPIPRPHRAPADVLSRAQGALIGQLAGDSLGGQVEFRSASAILAAHPAGVRELVDGGGWDTLAGQPTDDSEMALMLARTLVREGDYCAASVLASYVRWYRSSPYDLGGTTAQALAAAGQGRDPEHAVLCASAAASRSSQANGSLMRVSPLAIFLAGTTADDEEMARLARLDSALTHPHAVCQDACAVYVVAMARAIRDCLAPADCHRAALSAATRLRVAPEVLAVLERAQSAPPADTMSQMGWVLIALQNAFYQLTHAGGAAEGIVATVMGGGDTDTNACIAGALLGAVHGRESLPASWLRALESCRPARTVRPRHPRPREFWPTDVLSLAEALLTTGWRSPGH